MAFKPPAEWNPSGRVVWFPQKSTLANFETALALRGRDDSPFLQQPTRSALVPIRNSVITAGAGTLLAVLAGALSAFGIARFRAGGRAFPILLLQARAFPILTLTLPMFFLANEIGMWGTL